MPLSEGCVLSLHGKAGAEADTGCLGKRYLEASQEISRYLRREASGCTTQKRHMIEFLDILPSAKPRWESPWRWNNSGMVEKLLVV